VVDASAEYRILSSRGAMPGLALNLRLTNLLNARYEEVLHFLTPRRAIFVGGRLDLAP
jgi:outer membrane cobalamin receptor